jgi:hypothetical protein
MHSSHFGPGLAVYAAMMWVLPVSGFGRPRLGRGAEVFLRIASSSSVSGRPDPETEVAPGLPLWDSPSGADPAPTAREKRERPWSRDDDQGLGGSD